MADGRSGLFELLKTHVKEARVGGILGFVGSGTFLFTDVSNWPNFLGGWFLRLVMTCIIAIASAICTAWAKDVYSNYKEYRKKKEQDYEQRKRSKPNRGKAA